MTTMFIGLRMAVPITLQKKKVCVERAYAKYLQSIKLVVEWKI